RLAFLVAPDDEDVSRLRRLFVALKNNLGPKARPLAFTMASTPVRADGVKTEAPRITWFPVHRRVDPDEIFRNLQRAVRPLVTATNVLNHELQQGPVLQRIVVAALAAANVPLRTARRAKKKLKIESIQRARKWYWMLPGWTEAQIAAWSPGPQGATQKATPRNGHLTT